jgi:hypothetical protein
LNRLRQISTLESGFEEECGVLGAGQRRNASFAPGSRTTRSRPQKLKNGMKSMDMHWSRNHLQSSQQQVHTRRPPCLHFHEILPLAFALVRLLMNYITFQRFFQVLTDLLAL